MNKVKARVFLTALIALVLIITAGLCGCVRLHGNNRADTEYAVPEETDDEYIYNISALTYVHQTLTINKQTGEATIAANGEKVEGDYAVPECVVLKGSNFPRYTTYSAEGYEALPELLEERYKKDGANFIQYYAVSYGGEVYGFCNRYSKTAGILFGGGQIACEYIISGAYFRYGADGSFTELKSLNKCNIMAFNDEGVIYYKNKKYYAYADGAEKFLCNDEAYDGGLTSYSYVNVYFNGEHCLIIMHHSKTNYKKDYIRLAVCGYDGTLINSFKLPALYNE